MLLKSVKIEFHLLKTKILSMISIFYGTISVTSFTCISSLRLEYSIFIFFLIYFLRSCSPLVSTRKYELELFLLAWVLYYTSSNDSSDVYRILR